MERLAAHEFYVGSFYFKKKNYKGALVRFREVVGKYPNTELLDKALYFIGLSYDKLGEGELAADVYKTLVENYPDSPFASGAKKKIKSGIKKASKYESKEERKKEKLQSKEERKKMKKESKMVSKAESEMEGTSWGSKPLGCYVFSSLC
jgi:tetratricopeptide (TPR) repeat protein